MTMMSRAVFWLMAACLAPASLVHAAYEYFPGVGFYNMDPFKSNWTNNYEMCLFAGGNMAVINSRAELEVIKQMMTSRGHSQVQVGVSDFLVAGDYVAVTGESLDNVGFKSWLEGSPSQDKSLRCVVYNMNGSGGLSKIDCNSIGYSVCEKPLWSADYELLSGLGYYKLHTNGSSWRNAWQTCRTEGAKLAVINSEEEYTALQSIIRRHPDLPGSSNSSLFHIGLHAQYSMGYFITVDGVPVKKSGFNRWEAGHPTFNNGYAYLLRDAALISSLYNQNLAFICEHALYEKL